MSLTPWSQDSAALARWPPQLDRRAQNAHRAQKGKETERLLPHTDARASTDARTEADSDFKGQKQQEQRLQALVLGRLGSPSGRTPWTSCPVTWLFGVETGGRRRRPGEELWGLHWGGPVAESSRQSVLIVTLGRKQGGRQCSLWQGQDCRDPSPSERCVRWGRGQDCPSSATFCLASGSGF